MSCNFGGVFLARFSQFSFAGGSFPIITMACPQSLHMDTCDWIMPSSRDPMPDLFIWCARNVENEPSWRRLLVVRAGLGLGLQFLLPCHGG